MIKSVQKGFTLIELMIVVAIVGNAAEHGGAVVYSGPVKGILKSKESITGQINQLLTIIFALLGLAVIISILGIVNTLALSVVERTREVIGRDEVIALAHQQFDDADRMVGAPWVLPARLVPGVGPNVEAVQEAVALGVELSFGVVAVSETVTGFQITPILAEVAPVGQGRELDAEVARLGDDRDVAGARVERAHGVQTPESYLGAERAEAVAEPIVARARDIVGFSRCSRTAATVSRATRSAPSKPRTSCARHPA